MPRVLIAPLGLRDPFLTSAYPDRRFLMSADDHRKIQNEIDQAFKKNGLSANRLVGEKMETYLGALEGGIQASRVEDRFKSYVKTHAQILPGPVWFGLECLKRHRDRAGLPIYDEIVLIHHQASENEDYLTNCAQKAMAMFKEVYGKEITLLALPKSSNPALPGIYWDILDLLQPKILDWQASTPDFLTGPGTPSINRALEILSGIYSTERRYYQVLNPIDAALEMEIPSTVPNQFAQDLTNYCLVQVQYVDKAPPANTTERSRTLPSIRQISGDSPEDDARRVFVTILELNRQLVKGPITQYRETDLTPMFQAALDLLVRFATGQVDSVTQQAISDEIDHTKQSVSKAFSEAKKTKTATGAAKNERTQRADELKLLVAQALQVSGDRNPLARIEVQQLLLPYRDQIAEMLGAARMKELIAPDASTES